MPEPILVIYFIGGFSTFLILLLSYRDQINEAREPATLVTVLTVTWPIIWFFFIYTQLYNYFKQKEDEELEENSFKIPSGDYN